jgi:hypothetical protein
MRRRKRWWLRGALFAVTLVLGVATRGRAQAPKCNIVVADLQLEAVTVGGVPASAEPYAGHQVEVWGLPGAVRVTVKAPRVQGFYEETYRASPDAGR